MDGGDAPGGRDRLSLEELEAASGIPARRIRFYIDQAKLPGADRRGPGATYARATLDALRVLRLLTEAHGYNLASALHELRARRGAGWGGLVHEAEKTFGVGESGRPAVPRPGPLAAAPFALSAPPSGAVAPARGRSPVPARDLWIRIPVLKDEVELLVRASIDPDRLLIVRSRAKEMAVELRRL